MPLWLLAAAPAVVLAASWWRWRDRELRAQERAAWQALFDGDLARATEIFESLVRRQPRYAIELARLYALRGDVERATHYAAQARRALDRDRAVDRAITEARLLFVDALIATRRGQLDDAASTLASRWATFEKSPGGWLAEACLLRGYLAWKANASIEVWLGLSEDNRARVRWMSSDWPELQQFLDAS